MSLILTDIDGVTLYTFSTDFDLISLDDRDTARRSKILERFGQHGGIQVADGAVEPRKVKIKGWHSSASQSAFNSFLSGLYGALYNSGAPYRFSFEAGKYINVSQATFALKRAEQGLHYTAGEVEITLLCADPFWYSTAADTTGAVVLTSNPQALALTGSGNIDAPLRIQLDPAGPCPSVTIINGTDGGQWTRYADPVLGSGNQVIMDGGDGSCARDTVNTIRYLSGGFLRLLPGSNVFSVASATGGTVTLSAPTRWL